MFFLFNHKKKMYNLVISKYDGDYYFSVFDQKDNEIWNEKGDAPNLTDKLAQLNFTIKNIVNNDVHDPYLTEHLQKYIRLDKPSTRHYCSKEFGYDLPIANESYTGYGFNRYCHRNFVKMAKKRGLVR
jgi:hypothetical protein